MEQKLVVRELKKWFGTVRAVDGVSFELPAKAVMGIVGPNGSGKTTLLNLICQIVEPDSGSMEVMVRGNSHDITKMGPEEVSKVGISRSFQIPNIFEDLTISDNIRLGIFGIEGSYLDMKRRYYKDEGVNDKTSSILEEFGLKTKADQWAKDLSRGDRKALDLALAYSMGGEVMLLDEPTSGLSTTEKEEIVELVSKLREELGVTIMLVEHDLDVVYGIVDKMIVLHEGKILAEGVPEEVRDDEKVRRVFLGER